MSTNLFHFQSISITISPLDSSIYSIRFTISTSNLLIPKFEKFKETAKVFSLKDMNLVTRKGVYPYEYTDPWGKLKEITLPSKQDIMYITYYYYYIISMFTY